jgi:hypothetical protein
MAISFTPGQTVSWDDLNALMGQHGSPQGAKSVVKVERKPLTKEERNAIEDAGGDPDAPPTAQQQVYRYYFEDGSYVDASMESWGEADEQGRPRGTFRIVDYKPSQKYQTAQTPTAQQGTAVGSRQSTDAAGNVTKITTYERPDGTTYQREDTVTQAPKPATRDEKPVQVGGKNFIQVSTVDPATGQSRTVLLDPVTRAEVQPPVEPKPAQAVAAPSNQKWIARQNPTTNEVEFVRNQNYVPDSKLITDPTTGRMRVLTEDENGNPVLKDLDDRTTIKPADIPVLQATYGQIGRSLGAYLQDLNGRVSRGEITSQERDAAFKTAHQQAETQVSEINSILDNSKAVWTNQIAERNQQYGEAANRRSFAGSIMNNAVSTGRGIAEGALPGSGRAIAEGVMTLMDLGQRYAQGMGGFPSMQSIAPPPALQQAAGMNLPGFGPEASGAPPPTAAPVPAPGGTAAMPNAIGLGAVGALPAPGSPESPGARSAGGLPGIPPGGPPTPGPAGPHPEPLLPPPPHVPGKSPVAPPVGLAPAVGGPTPSPLPFTGQNPNPTPLGALGSQFGAGMAGSPIGVPAAAGGGGYFDRNQEAQSMLAASMTGGYGGAGVADPEWERAVREAMGMVG